MYRKTRCRNLKDRIRGCGRLLLACCLLVLCCHEGYAEEVPASGRMDVLTGQDGSTVVLKGKVVDEDYQPLPGVSVLVKGSRSGVATDNKGQFSLSAPRDRGLVLVFSFIGMEKREVEVTDPGKQIFVIMSYQPQSLEEVVKTGYYSTTKRRASGSVAVLTADALENRIPTSVDNLLQGQVAGVAVTNVGRPGASAKVRIRGTNTIDGSNEPLWVVDGVPLQDDLPRFDADKVNVGNLNEIFMNGIAGINAADIENITVLKDAAAAAIYGSRAAGGVIVITTKKGNAGKVRVNFSTRFGMGLRPQRDGDLMNASEKLAWEEELWNEFAAPHVASGSGNVPVVGIVGMLRTDKLGKGGMLWTKDGYEPMTEAEKRAYVDDLKTGSTDWYKEIFRNSFDMSHHLSFSGGNSRATYYGSIGYSNQEGLLKEDKYDKYTMNLKVNWTPSQKIKWGMAASLSQLVSDGPSLDVDPFTYAYFANPYEKVYNADGTYRADMTYFNLSPINDGGIKPEKLPADGFNIIRELKETEGKAKKFSAGLQANVNWNITSKLQFSGLASYAYTDNREVNVLGKNTYAAWKDRLAFDRDTERRYGSITRTSGTGDSYNVRGQFSYTDLFAGSHFLNVLAGAELRGTRNKRFSGKEYGYNPDTGLSSMPENPDPDRYDEDWYTDLIDELNGFTRSESRFASFYASMEYAYLERYIMNASFRTDGSNNFGSNEQFNPTWSLGAAWNIDQEDFMESLKPVLNRLTFRVATGFTGNVVPGKLKNLIVKFNTSKNWNDMQMGSVSSAPNPYLRWEKTRDLKFALDFGLFNDRISGLFEAYFRKSMDVISSVRVVSTTGFKSQSYNSSDIENKGVEATLRARIIDGKDFRLNLNANLAWNRNVLSKYTSTNGMVKDGKYVGYPLESIFGGRQLGIDLYDGVYSYQLRPDAVISEAWDLQKPVNYRYYLGTSIAPFTGGFYLNMSYRNLSLGIGGAYSFGAKIDNRPADSPANYDMINYSSYVNESPQTAYSDLYTNHLNVRRDRTDRWTEERPSGVKYPRIVDAFGEKLYLDQYNPSDSKIIIGSFLENVSYLRIRDITLSYNMPDKWLKPAGISSLQFSLMLNNFFTFTNFSGIDPETPGQTYPITRTVAFGINLGF